MKATLTIFFVLLFASFSWGISEQNYSEGYQEKVVPFLLEHEEQFSFPSADKKYDLSAVRLINPQEKGVIVIVQGRCESWLLYGEVFYDLYNKGYSIYAYDHRGQGLSPHLVKKNLQIGYVDYFSDYVDDLAAFLKTVIQPVHPQKEGLFVIAHSMGAAITADFLENNISPFAAVAFTSPMLKINTTPFLGYTLEESLNATLWDSFSQNQSNTTYYTYTNAEEELLGCSMLACSLGYGKDYAVGQHDQSKTRKMDEYTGSKERWAMMTSFGETNPQAILGGISWRWLEQALSTIPLLVVRAPQINTKLLVFEAGSDQIVINSSTDQFCSSVAGSRLVQLPQSQHQVFMEQDTIRDQVFKEIEAFFQ